jgi:hypothetical protein
MTRCVCGIEKEASTGTVRNGFSCGCICRATSGVSRRLPNNGAARNANLKKYMASAKKRELVWALSDEEFDILTSGNCYYCEIEPRQICRMSAKGTRKWIPQVIYNGIDRLDNFIGYEFDNCVSCCKVCNRAKDVMSVEDFIAWVNRVHEHYKPLATAVTV